MFQKPASWTLSCRAELHHLHDCRPGSGPSSLAEWSSDRSLCVSPGCAERVEVHTERRGVIYSPSWPLNYPPGVNCSWHIQGGQGEVITVR